MKLKYLLRSCRKIIYWAVRVIGKLMFKVPFAVVKLIKTIFRFSVNPNNARKVGLIALVLALMYIA